MILGVGIDLCKISRIEKAVKFKNFIDKIFTKEEIFYAESKKNKNFIIQSYASAFAAREAFSKASGISLGIVAFNGNFSISRNENGKPVAKLSKKIEAELKIPVKIFVSLTHDGDYAAAIVIIEEDINK